MPKNRKFSPTLQMKFREPFQHVKNPENGANSIINLDAMDCIDVEVRGQGCGLYEGKPAEYLDLRVYLTDKSEGKQ